MSDIKSVLVRHAPEDPPIVTELVNSLVVNNDFTVKLALVKKGQTVTESSFIPSGFVIACLGFVGFVCNICCLFV